MALRANPSLCVILLSWICVSGELYTFNGTWHGEMAKCDDEGIGSDESHFDLGTWQSVRLPFDQLDNDTTVKAIGEMKFNTSILGPRMRNTISLSIFNDTGDSKVYSNQVGIGGTRMDQMQMGTIELSLIIHKTGQVLLDKGVYAESWKSVGCTTVNSTVSTISFEV